MRPETHHFCIVLDFEFCFLCKLITVTVLERCILRRLRMKVLIVLLRRRLFVVVSLDGDESESVVLEWNLQRVLVSAGARCAFLSEYYYEQDLDRVLVLG